MADHCRKYARKSAPAVLQDPWLRVGQKRVGRESSFGGEEAALRGCADVDLDRRLSEMYRLG